ncbi:hypothetical protein GCM10027060_19510 [Nesterenkonia halophila]|uniref:phosphotransferase family protein n=1 Tax=Nesterenkonia halophila TaxID=302044 RepID=UPI00129142D3|nr:hypothetical protein [Nesterenkonia halophila]
MTGPTRPPHAPRPAGVPAPTRTEADAVAAAAIRLPGAATVLDASALSEVLGRSVEVRRLRLKPGRSLVASVVDDHGRHAWVLLTDDADKVAAAHRRASRRGGTVLDRRLDGLRLLSGEILDDPELARELDAARERMPGLVAQILRYNPRRRVVGTDAEQATVVRVAARSQDHLVAAAGRWRAAGVPVLDHQIVGRRGTAVASPLWGTGDLLAPSAAASPRTVVSAAAAAGTAIGRLHRRTLRTAPADGARGLRRLEPGPQAAAASLAVPAPWVAAEARDLAGRLAATLPSDGSAADGVAELHGDLSPDQLLIGEPAGAAAPEIRLVDLDRCGLGDPMRDAGSWLAACRRLTLPHLAKAFLDGYAAEAPVDPARLAGWEAHAHLEAAGEPFRRRDRDWPQAMRRTLDHARRAADRAEEDSAATAPGRLDRGRPPRTRRG